MAKWKMDFTGVKDGFDVTPGNYVAKCLSVTKEKGSSNPYLKWELEIISGEAKGFKLNHLTSLSPKAMFAVRNVLMAMGLDVPKSAISIDPAKLIGKTLGIEVYMKPSDDGEKEYANVKKVFLASKVEADVSDVIEDDEDDDDDLEL